MSKPTNFNANGGKQEIADLNSAIDSMLKEPAVEAPSAPAVGTTANFNEPSGSDKPKKEYKWSTATQAAIGRLGQSISEKTDAVSPILTSAYSKAASQTRIVAYCSGYNERVDFKKVTTTTKDKPKEHSVSVVLAMMKPKKPDRVIVKYPLDIISQITGFINNGATLDTNSINNAMKQTTAEGAYAVKILKFSRKEHELFDWTNKYIGRNFLQEDEAIFTPYAKKKANGFEFFRTYTGEAKYSATGGTPGILMSASLSTSAKPKDGSTTNFEVDLISPSERKFVVTYSNPGRPTWSTPDNTIYDKIFDTIPAGVPDDAQDFSKRYFLRFVDANLEFKRPAGKEMDVYTPTGTIATAISAAKANNATVETFNVGVVSDPGFWSEVSVEDWYPTITNDTATYKTYSGSSLRLVNRVGKVNKDKTKTTYSAVLKELKEQSASGDANPYLWENALSDKIKKALGGIELSYSEYKAAASSIKSTSTKVKSRTSIPVNIPGLTFSDLEKVISDALNGTNSVF